jgi:hypothetical protein
MTMTRTDLLLLDGLCDLIQGGCADASLAAQVYDLALDCGGPAGARLRRFAHGKDLDSMPGHPVITVLQRWARQEMSATMPE